MPSEKKIYTSFHDIPPRDYMYFPKGTIDVGKPGHFSRTEVIHLLLSIIVLTVAFSFALTGNNVIYGFSGGFNFGLLPMGMLMAFLGVVTAFFFHELSHKFMAQRYKLWAEYRMFPQGLLLSLIMGVFTPFVFAAPGAVMFMGGSRDYETGQIAMAGPLANIIISLVTFPLSIIFFETAGTILIFICYINALLAFFNLLPLGPLDGVKIIRWNATVWVILLILAISMFILVFPKISVSF